jgi:hypothetical protein
MEFSANLDDEEKDNFFSRLREEGKPNETKNFQENEQSKSIYLRHQSIIDPDKEKILLNYDLDEFKNSIWENFLGSQV